MPNIRRLACDANTIETFRVLVTRTTRMGGHIIYGELLGRRSRLRDSRKQHVDPPRCDAFGPHHGARRDIAIPPPRLIARRVRRTVENGRIVPELGDSEAARNDIVVGWVPRSRQHGTPPRYDGRRQQLSGTLRRECRPCFMASGLHGRVGSCRRQSLIVVFTTRPARKTQWPLSKLRSRLGTLSSSMST